MVPFVDSLFIFITSLVAVAILGLIAGFSPTLYIAQITVAAKKQRALPYTIGLMSGVLGAIIVLLLLFQVFQLDTLITFIDSTVSALVVSVSFNIIVGCALIVGGLWYIRSREDTAKENRDKATARGSGGISALVGLGFVRTLTSISGLTATFIASGIIGSTNPVILERILTSGVFLAATIVPFAGIIILLRRNPKKLTTATARVRALLKRANYRLVAGVAAVLLGGSIIVFNLMMALFY